MSRSLRARALMACVGFLMLNVAASGQVNAVYVESNLGNGAANTIIGYSNDGTGNLTPLPGSPYLTGGSGVAPPAGQSLTVQTDDDQQVIINPEGTLLFAVDGGSNDIAVFNINSDASLSPIAGSPWPSNGSDPSSLGLLDNALGNGSGLLVVANKSSDVNQVNPPPPNINTYTVAVDGTLTQNTALGSTRTLPLGASPSQVAIGKSKLIFDDEFHETPSSIRVFRIKANGSVGLLSTTPVPNGDHVFLGEIMHPTKGVMYAALPADSLIGVYRYSTTTGALTFVTTVANPGQLACWFAMDKAATRLYTAESMSNSVTVYDITNPLLPVQIQHLSLISTSGDGGPGNIALDQTGQFLYTVNRSSLHVLNVAADGTLTESIQPVNMGVPAGNYPFGLATILK